MTEVQLCNMAMVFLKVQRIESMDEESEQADLCSEYLQICIDDALTYSHHFTFCKTHIEIETPLEETYRDYEFLYPIPEGFLQPIEMVNLENGDWEFTSTGIACNVEPLEMVYLKTVTEVSKLPNHVSRAVAYRLAMTIGPLLSPSAGEEIGMAVQLFEQYMKEAANQDGRKQRLSVKGEYSLLEDS